MTKQLPDGERAVMNRRTALRLLAGSGAFAAMLANPALALADTESDLADAQQRYNEAEAELEAIASEYEAAASQLATTMDEMGEIQGEIDDLEAQIAEKQESLDEKRAELSRAVADEYKDGNRGLVDILLGSATLEEFIANLHAYDKVTAASAALIQSIQVEQNELTDYMYELEAEQASLEDRRATQQTQLQTMQQKQADAQAVVDGLDSEVQELMAQREDEILAAQEEARAAEEARQAAEAAAAAAAQESSTSSSTNSSNSSSNSSNSSSSSDSSSSSSDSSSSSVSGSQAKIVASCKTTPSPGAGLCAAWVSNVFVNAGYGFVGGNACDMYANYCNYSSQSDLKLGMIVAVSTHSHTTAGRIYGHIGIYIGNGTLMDNIGYIRTISLSEWISYYSTTVQVRWGWLGNIVLS